MNEFTLKSRLLASSVFAGAAFGLMGMHAYAQEQEEVETVEAAAEDEARQETVFVTGSRIAQTNLDSPVPVSQFDAAQIDLSGAVNVSEVLRTLPATGVSGLTSTNSNFTVTASGINTVELRNLGEDRTLVLVNGRRFVGGVPGSQIVDFNQIPTEFIERIDVITGGASAVYGSDALAGVVNIILKDDIDGVTITGQGGISEAEDLETYRASITGGGDFANGRGNAAASLTWSRNNGAFFRDREGQGVDDLSYAAFTGNVDDVLTPVSEILGRPFFSSFSERGRFFAPGVGNQTFDETSNEFREYVAAADGFNRQAFRALSIPNERITASAILDYEISPWANFFTEITYSSTDTQSRLEPFPLGGDDIYGSQPFCVDDDGDGTDDRCVSGAPITGAFVPDAFRDLIRSANPGIPDEDLVYGFARRTTEVNARGAFNTRQTARIVTGFDGGFDNGINYEVSLNWGRTTQNQESTGGIDVRNFAAALDSVVDPDTGEIICRDETARDQGCVPINIFGQGSISPEAAAYVRADSKFDAEIEQTVVNAFLTGDSTILAGFELPAGPISWVAGYEWREESSSEIPDALSQSGLNAGNVTPITVGGFDVWEVFGELEIPILVDQPWAEELSLNLAARHSDYSSVGETFAWSANAEYQPISSIRFRSQYAEAVRAPNISEAFDGLGETFATISDPCAGVTRIGGTPAFGPDDDADASRIANVCLQDPLVAARVDRDGAFIPTQPEIQGIGGLVGGAIAGGFDLKEEEATTFTVGVVWNPDYTTWLDPFAISVDYFDIEITDAIGTLGRQTSLNRCYGNGDDNITSYDPDSAFCTNVIRYDVGPFLGAAEFVNSFSQNLSTIETSGIDVQMSYDWDLTNTFRSETDLGFLGASFTYQYLEDYTSTAFPGAEPSESVGAQGLSEHEGLLALVYDRGPLTVSLDTTWIGETEDSYGFLNEPFFVDDVYFTDVQARYRVLDDLVTLVFGVDNIADEFVPTGIGLVGGVGQYTNDAVYDSLGRRYYAGFRLEF